MFMISGESLTPWVLFLEQESYMSYINIDYKIYTIILKNHVQKTLDAIIGEKQSAVIKKRTTFRIFFIRDLIDGSKKSKNNVA